VTSSLSNADIAEHLLRLAQLLANQKGNTFKVRAYQRAATRLRTIPESVAELVCEGADLKQYAGIGDAISSAIQEIVSTGRLERLEALLSAASPELIGISEYPRLDPVRVLRIYRRLKISSIEELRQRLEGGEIARVLGHRMAQHVAQGLSEPDALLLYKADDLRTAIEQYLIDRCKATRVEAAGDYRRRVEVIRELCFVVGSSDFEHVVSMLERYGGGTPLVASGSDHALLMLSAGVLLRVHAATKEEWGSALIAHTGSEAHLRKLTAHTRMELLPCATEEEAYSRAGLAFIEPELREGIDEVEKAALDELPVLVRKNDLRGELHAHSTSSDGSHTIEQMAAAAQSFGYEYIGITDHSQSLKIARGVSIEDLWNQIRFIDRLNERTTGIRILKAAEVDILADGSLDYPDDLLKELDYTMCSIHSRFALGRTAQTERILRAMDNRYFNIMGHATGRLLLKRPGYEIDVERVIAHARNNGCFFEINSSPDRLDLSAENARIAGLAGVRIAICTDAHSTREFDLVRYGVDQARRAGLTRQDVLNCLPWQELAALFRR
jgi:DNA polymerase (family 10)